MKKKDYEKLTSSNVQHVIELLSKERPITKKEACEILNISYNTTRLNKIIEEHNNKIAYTEKRRGMNKGKKAQPHEIREAILEYLQGENVSEIAKGMYRSAGFVKGILERIGVPQRPPSAEERGNPAFLPENCVAEEFTPGEKVWSAQYHSPAIVEKEVEVPNRYESKGYTIYVLEKTEGFNVGGFYAYVLACELGKLTHLEQYGVNLTKI